MIKYLVAALCLLVPVAALGQGSRTPSDKWPHYNVADLPATCVADTDMVIVDDSTTVGGCSVGGGAEPGICICNTAGTGFEPVTGTGNDSQTDHEERYGIANVLDYGAACDLFENAGTANVTDDAVEIQAAIDAVKADSTLSNLFFPRACFTTVTIDWEKGVNLIGTNTGGRSALQNGQPSGGIYCGRGMNDDCIVTVNAADDFHHTRMLDFTVSKTKYCSENPTHPCLSSGGGCTCTDSDDTLGSGIVFNDYLGEGTGLEAVWVNGFPEFGLEINQGIQGNGHMAMLSIWGNGQAPPITGTATVLSGANDLTDTGNFTGLTLDGWFVRTTGGTGSGQTRRISSNTDDVLSIPTTWTTNVDTDTTYEVDHGGGILLDNTNVIAACSIDGVSGDGNAPALIVVAEGSGGEHAGSGPMCVIRNIKSEYGASVTYKQRNALRLINNGMRVRLEGVRHTDITPWGGAIIYFEGKGSPREVEYSALGMVTGGRSDYVVIDTSGVDTTATQISILGDSTPTHEGSIPNDMRFHPLSTPPFACNGALWRGNRYYNIDINEECICNGSAWKPVSDPAGTTCT